MARPSEYTPEYFNRFHPEEQTGIALYMCPSALIRVYSLTPEEVDIISHATLGIPTTQSEPLLQVTKRLIYKTRGDIYEKLHITNPNQRKLLPHLIFTGVIQVASTQNELFTIPNRALTPNELGITIETDSQKLSKRLNVSPNLTKYLELAMLGFSYREIAQQFNVVEGTVNNVLSNEIKKHTHLTPDSALSWALLNGVTTVKVPAK